MRAMRVHELGEPEVMRLETLPDPAPGPGEIRVALKAAGVNFVDLLMCRGGYQFKPELPFTPGMESAGEVVALGEGVNGFAVGERVITTHKTGGYATEVVLPATGAFHLPEALSFAEGATLMSGHATAYHALVDRGQLGPGETALIHGAAGGVGMAAVRIAKLLGATVIATASTDEKCAAARAQGADHTINIAETPRFRDRVKELTEGRGADVVYDPVGGDVFDESIRCINWMARLLIVGFAGGRIAQAPTNYLLIKGASAIGLRAGEHARRDPEAGAANRRQLLTWAAEGRIRPHISHELPLEEAVEMLNLVKARRIIGRAALICA
jgi:NADPH2:quinone reductase